MYYQRKRYETTDDVRKAKSDYEEKKASRPGEYSSAWKPQLESTLEQIQSRKPFSYDPGSDALYRQYQDRYITQGKQAMMDTMGQAAAMTGGYSNSYAQTVGQQTYQGYLQGLNDKLPELYQQALNRYQMETDDLYNRYSLLSQQENQDYSRYRDVLSDWYADTDALYNNYLAERDFDYARYTDEENWAYQQARDQVSDDRWQQEFDYNKQRDQKADEQWQMEYEENKRRYEEGKKTGSSGGSGGSGAAGEGNQEQVRMQELAQQLDALVRQSGGKNQDYLAMIQQNTSLNKKEKQFLQEMINAYIVDGTILLPGGGPVKGPVRMTR